MSELSNHAIVRFEVRNGKEKEAETAILEFVATVRAKEPDTLEYRSLRNRENVRRYCHMMRFRSPEAHRQHRETEHVRRFVEKLYPSLYSSARAGDP